MAFEGKPSTAKASFICIEFDCGIALLHQMRSGIDLIEPIASAIPVPSQRNCDFLLRLGDWELRSLGF